MLRVAIVGGGVAGLASAAEILRRDPRADVVLLEASPRAGGHLRTERIDGYLCEAAASAFLDNCKGGALDLCARLSIPVERASPSAKRRWLWHRGALRELSPRALLGGELLGWSGKLRAIREPFVPKNVGEETVAAFLRTRFGAEVARTVGDALVRGIFAGDAHALSFSACFPRLAALVNEHGSLARGFWAEKRAGRLRASALWAPEQGLGAVVDRLARDLGDRVLLSSRVEAIEPGALRLQDGRSLAADHLILAVPAPAAATIVRSRDSALADLLQKTPDAQVVVAHVGFARKDVPHALDGFGFIVNPGEALRCLGCVFESSVWKRRAPEGHVHLRLIYGGAADPAAFDLDDESLRAQVAADLRLALGIETAPNLLHIVRHRQGIPQYVLGHAARVVDADERARALGVHLVGSAFHGVGVNDCIQDAARVAAAIIP